MKKIIFVLAVILLTSFHAISQCDRKMKWHATKADMFDAKVTLLDSKEGTIIVETDTQKITVSFKESTEDGLDGTIKEKQCNWKDPFKNGKTVYHSNVNVDGKTSKAMFTIEAKEGQITISVDIEIMDGRKFLIYVDSYEELK